VHGRPREYSIVAVRCMPKGLLQITILHFPRKHMQNKHNVQNLPYSALTAITGTVGLLQLPDNELREAPFPLVAIKNGVACANGHISVSKKALKKKDHGCCMNVDCRLPVKSIQIQEIGSKRYRISGERANLELGVAMSDEFLSSCTLMEEAMTEETRATNPVHNVINVEKVFPSSDWPLNEWKVKLNLVF
jgi:hypothetical protein